MAPSSRVLVLPHPPRSPRVARSSVASAKAHAGSTSSRFRTCSATSPRSSCAWALSSHWRSSLERHASRGVGRNGFYRVRRIVGKGIARSRWYFYRFQLWSTNWWRVMRNDDSLLNIQETFYKQTQMRRAAFNYLDATEALISQTFAEMAQ